MKRGLLTAGAVTAVGCGVALQLLGVKALAPEAVPGDRLRVRVVDVVDGDTLRAETLAGAPLGKVRLLGIDAPELAHRAEATECYAQAATDQLKRLLPSGTIVTLAADPQQPAKDNYGRLLRYVYWAGDDVSTALLAAGAARLYDAVPALARDRQLRTAAAQAQSEQLGLWGACPDAR